MPSLPLPAGWSARATRIGSRLNTNPIAHRQSGRIPISPGVRNALTCCSPAGAVSLTARFSISLQRPCRQVEPLPFAVAQGRQADPVQHLRLVAVQVKDGGGWRAVEEVNAPLR